MNNGSMWAGIAVAIGIGAILPLQGLLNARLGTQIGGPVAAAFVSFVVGTLGLKQCSKTMPPSFRYLSMLGVV